MFCIIVEAEAHYSSSSDVEEIIPPTDIVIIDSDSDDSNSSKISRHGRDIDSNDVFDDGVGHGFNHDPDSYNNSDCDVSHQDLETFSDVGRETYSLNHSEVSI